MNAPFDLAPPTVARRRQLVSATWLAARCAGGVPSNWQLLEVGCGARDQFEQAHLAGAAYLDTGELEGGPLWNKVDDAALLALLLRRGIGHDSTVILYGRSLLAPARAAHLLLYAGVVDVRLVDGGWNACRAAGMACAVGPGRQTVALGSFGAAFPGRPDFVQSTTGVQRLLATPGAQVVSIRTWAEHSGATSGYSYIAQRGDIAGARWGRAGEDGDVNSMSAFHDDQYCMRPAGYIAAMWASQDIRPGAGETTFYCGTGWRASLAFFYAYVMGWERISVYDGGWLEWSGGAHHVIACNAPFDWFQANA